MNNTGQQGAFVLPLAAPTTTGSTAQTNDFTFAAMSWTLTAHEARPGHELQFASMVEHGVSLARALYAFNSANVEGWGLYAEHIMKPFEPLDGQLFTLQSRMLRAARAFIDPELESGVLTPAQGKRVLTDDVVLSEAFAGTEIERYTFQAPGQATSYFYGYLKLLELRKEVEAKIGTRFDQRAVPRFHPRAGIAAARPVAQSGARRFRRRRREMNQEIVMKRIVCAIRRAARVGRPRLGAGREAAAVARRSRQAQGGAQTRSARPTARPSPSSSRRSTSRKTSRAAATSGPIGIDGQNERQITSSTESESRRRNSAPTANTWRSPRRARARQRATRCGCSIAAAAKRFS